MRTPATSPTTHAAETFRATYGVPRSWVLAFDALGILVVLVFAGLLTFQETHLMAYRILVREHGPIELTTFLAFLVAGIVAAYLARAASARKEPGRVTWGYAGFAAFCLLCAGEEISWGQALVHYATPFGLRNVNVQGELNIHNLPGVMELNSAFVLVFGLAGLAGIRLGRRPGFRYVGVPEALGPLFGWIAFMGVLAVATDLFLIQYSFDLIVGMLTEAVEMLAALASLATVALNAVMLRRECESRGPAPA